MRRALARVLRVVADQLFHEEPEEGVRLFGDVPEYMLTPVLEAISRAAFERAWPCKKCEKLVSVDRRFVADEGPKWVMCGNCAANSGRSWDA